MTDRQLEEFIRIMVWRFKKEAYAVFHVGGGKEERERAIARYSARENKTGRWHWDLLLHLQGLHRYNQQHKRPRRP